MLNVCLSSLPACVRLLLCAGQVVFGDFTAASLMKTAARCCHQTQTVSWKRSACNVWWGSLWFVTEQMTAFALYKVVVVCSDTAVLSTKCHHFKAERKFIDFKTFARSAAAGKPAFCMLLNTQTITSSLPVFFQCGYFLPSSLWHK